MAPQQYASMQPGDTALVRVKVFPHGRGHPADGDAGDHIKVEIEGGAIVWVPIAAIAGVLHPAEIQSSEPQHLRDARARIADRADVIAVLCGPLGRKVAA